MATLLIFIGGRRPVGREVENWAWNVLLTSWLEKVREALTQVTRLPPIGAAGPPPKHPVSRGKAGLSRQAYTPALLWSKRGELPAQKDCPRTQYTNCNHCLWWAGWACNPN